MKRALLAVALLLAGMVSAQAQFIQPYAGAVSRTNNAKMADTVSVLDFIPVSLHAAILAGTSTTDVSSYLTAAQAAVPIWRAFVFPGGQYRLDSSVTLTDRPMVTTGATFTGSGSIVGGWRQWTSADDSVGSAGTYMFGDPTSLTNTVTTTGGTTQTFRFPKFGYTNDDFGRLFTAYVEINEPGNPAQLGLTRFNGTLTSPTALSTNDQVMSIWVRPYLGSGSAWGAATLGRSAQIIGRYTDTNPAPASGGTLEFFTTYPGESGVHQVAALYSATQFVHFGAAGNSNVSGASASLDVTNYTPASSFTTMTQDINTQRGHAILRTPQSGHDAADRGWYTSYVDSETNISIPAIRFETRNVAAYTTAAVVSRDSPVWYFGGAPGNDAFRITYNATNTNRWSAAGGATPQLVISSSGSADGNILASGSTASVFIGNSGGRYLKVTGSAASSVDLKSTDGDLTLESLGGGGSVKSNSNFIAAGTLSVGTSGSVSGAITVGGSTSGTVTINPQAAAGTPTLVWPTGSGTFAVSATTPLTLSATTGALTCSTCGVTGTGLTQFASTTSAQLAGVLSDETGSGAAVFANTPSLVTPNIGAATGTSVVLTSTATATAHRTATTTINDDAAASFTPAGQTGVIVLHDGANEAATLWFRVDGSPQLKDIGTRTSNVDITTGVLSGTTGTDTKLTVSAASDGKIYFENRIGGARGIRYTVLSTD